jgi:uncharacterized protein with NRDE domain
MCLILFSNKQSSGYRLVLAANRDEYYNRATARLDFWKDKPDILAGRDLVSGGTWLGITKTGRFAAVTSFRTASPLKTTARSRGLVVSDYLESMQTPAEYIKQLMGKADEYNGFSLICGDHNDLSYYSNHEHVSRVLDPGIYGLSNSLLDTEWPKVKNGKLSFNKLLSVSPLPPPDDFFSLLADQTQPPDSELPGIGSDKEWDRTLSSIFIKNPQYKYGTRSSALLFYQENGRVVFLERSFASGKMEDRKFEFWTK